MSHFADSSPAPEPESGAQASPVGRTEAVGRTSGLIRFWLRSLVFPSIAPLLVLAGVGFDVRDPNPVGASAVVGAESGLATAVTIAWAVGLVVALAALRRLLEPGARGVTTQTGGRSAVVAPLRGAYRSGRVLVLAAQVLFLTLLLPADAHAIEYWALATGAAFALLLLLAAPEEFHPGALVLAFVGLTVLIWPREIFSTASASAGLASGAAVCLPAGLNFYGGCLSAELAPAAVALHVVLALLLHFRRYAPPFAVLLALVAAFNLMGASGALRDSLATLAAVILFFPGRPYLPALAWFARAAFWLLGICGYLLFAPGVVPAGSAEPAFVLYPAFVVGLLLSETTAAGLRSFGLHL